MTTDFRPPYASDSSSDPDDDAMNERTGNNNNGQPNGSANQNGADQNGVGQSGIHQNGASQPDCESPANGSAELKLTDQPSVQSPDTSEKPQVTYRGAAYPGDQSREASAAIAAERSAQGADGGASARVYRGVR